MVYIVPRYYYLKPVNYQHATVPPKLDDQLTFEYDTFQHMHLWKEQLQ